MESLFYFYNQDVKAYKTGLKKIAGLQSAGFEKPSPIQLKAIPLGRCGLDLIVQAKSGTGKTCVFSVIALESLDLQSNSTQVLVLAPTREIAVQIQEVIHSIGSAITGLRCHVFIGGTMIGPDRQKLKKCHIAVGTPGRVKQLIEFELLKTESLRLFVLDEADKLLDHKFKEQVNWIYHKLAENKQMLALSATYPEYLAQQLTQYMRDPMFVRLNRKDLALHGIKQYYKIVPGHRLPNKAFEVKVEHLIHILSHVAFNQCLVFSNLQTRAQNLSEMLNFKGWPSTYISGNQEQAHRLSAMAMLKKFQCRILISTDLTARGIDAENVNLIINLDVPFDIKTYFHRIGRAGRFGTQGAAITLASAGQEDVQLTNIKKQCHGKMLPLPDNLSSDLVTHNQTPKDLGYSASSDSDDQQPDKYATADHEDGNQKNSAHNQEGTAKSGISPINSQNGNRNGRDLNLIHNKRKTPKSVAKKPGIDVGCQATPDPLAGIIGINKIDFKIPSLSMYRKPRCDHWTYEKAKQDFEIFLDPSKASSFGSSSNEKTEGEESLVINDESNQSNENKPVQKSDQIKPNQQQVVSSELGETLDESNEVVESPVLDIQVPSLEMREQQLCNNSNQNSVSLENTPSSVSNEESSQYTLAFSHTDDQDASGFSKIPIPQVNSILPNGGAASSAFDSNEQNHDLSVAATGSSASLKNDPCKDKDENRKQNHQKIGPRRIHQRPLSVGQMLQQLQTKPPSPDNCQAGKPVSGVKDPVWDMYKQYLSNSLDNTVANNSKSSDSETSSATSRDSSDSSSVTEDSSGSETESNSDDDGESHSASETESDESESESDEETETLDQKAVAQHDDDAQYREADYETEISRGIQDMTFNQYGNPYEQNRYDHWDSNPLLQNYSYSQYYQAPYHHGYQYQPYHQDFGEYGNWYNMY